MYTQDGGQNNYGIVVNSWTQTDAGNCYQITEAIVEQSESGVENIVTTQPSEIIYDLQGRRVSNPTKGIYIQGGKKFVLR